MGSKEIEERVSEIYEAVRSEAKTRTKETPKDKPALHTPPPSSRIEKKTRRRKAKGQSVVEGSAVTLKDLAFEFETDSKTVRRRLRRAGIQRESGRWEWAENSKALKKIRKLLA